MNKHKLDKIAAMRLRSGNISSNDKLVGFLYDLMRDHLPLGIVEELIQNSENMNCECVYTNGWLAQYAIDLAARLKSEE
jgi:hypothetical protein